MKIDKTVLILIFAAVIALMGVMPADAGSIDTSASWDPSNPFDVVGALGVGNLDFFTPMYGEVFTVTGSDTVLKNFTFYINQDPSTTFTASIYAWNGLNTDITAQIPAPFSSPPIVGSTLPSLSGAMNFDAVTFKTSLTLTAGQQYLLVATASSTVSDFGNSFGALPVSSDPNTGTRILSPEHYFVYNYGDGSGGWLNAIIQDPVDGSYIGPPISDLAFTPVWEVAVVPEPATILLLGTGIWGFAAYRLKRGKRTLLIS